MATLPQVLRNIRIELIDASRPVEALQSIDADPRSEGELT